MPIQYASMPIYYANLLCQSGMSFQYFSMPLEKAKTIIRNKNKLKFRIKIELEKNLKKNLK
jgi:hypothetical protein